jgi:hypothetical protein
MKFMDNKRNVLICGLIIIILGLLAYTAILNRKETTLIAQISEKDKIINEHPSPTQFIDFRKAEDQIIQLITSSEKYKTEAKYVEPYAHIRFRNSGFETDGLWFYGTMTYANVYKDNDSFVVVDSNKPLTPILDGYEYILKFSSLGQIERLSVAHISPDEEWNKSIDELPENIMPESEKTYFRLSTDN